MGRSKRCQGVRRLPFQQTHIPLQYRLLHGQRLPQGGEAGTCPRSITARKPRSVSLIRHKYA